MPSSGSAAITPPEEKIFKEVKTMIKHGMKKLFNSRYRKASKEVEKARRLIRAMATCGSLSTVKR